MSTLFLLLLLSFNSLFFLPPQFLSLFAYSNSLVSPSFFGHTLTLALRFLKEHLFFYLSIYLLELHSLFFHSFINSLASLTLTFCFFSFFFSIAVYFYIIVLLCLFFFLFFFFPSCSFLIAILSPCL